MYPEENRIPKQKFNTTVHVNMQIKIPIEAMTAEIAAGFAELAADHMIQKASPTASLKLCNTSQFKIKGVNVKPNERRT